MDTLKLLFLLYLRPAFAMSELIDRGSWPVAAGLVLIVAAGFFVTVNAPLERAYHIPTFAEFYAPDVDFEDDTPAARAAFEKATADYRQALATRPRIPLVGDAFFRFFSFEPQRFYQPLLALSLFYVPLAILLISIFGGQAGFGVLLRGHYGELATCTLTAWAAAHLPFVIAGYLGAASGISPLVLLGCWAASGILFGVFTVFALRTAFGANYGAAVLVVCLAWPAFSLGMYVFKFISPWLFSPFLLIYGYLYFGGALTGEARGIGDAFRQKQDFKRFLHNATVNPHDADAHVQLGLIYLQRRQDEKAREHFEKAFAIDPAEIDANYELGKLARRRGELQTALDYFAVVVEQNEKHALSEIWREIGATYLEAAMLDEARAALEKFVERRPVDSEGLYYLGRVLKTQGHLDRAREMFREAVTSARTAPPYRRRELRPWGKLAEKEL